MTRYREDMRRARERINSFPTSLELNDWSLTGDWTAEAERVVSNEPNGRIERRRPRSCRGCN